MNQIEILKQKLEVRIPAVKAEIDEPRDPTAPWVLDVHSNNRVVTVEWRAHRGFGISATEGHAYGDGPDEIVTSPEAAAERIRTLLETGGTTAIPAAVTLAELRERCRLSQAELADRLGVTQARVSALEKAPPRSQLKTIRKAIEALGAQVEIRAILANRQTIALDLSETSLPKRPAARRRSIKRRYRLAKASKAR
jgi:transcriptional regulator with XRE-family HTH domain